MKNNKNNNLLQNSFIKNFAINNTIKWERYQANEGGTFDINDINDESRLDAYNQEVKKDIITLEQQGLQVVNKIVQETNENEKIKLTRQEAVTLKFFSLLLGVESSDKKDSQEAQLTSILKYFKQFTKTGSISVQKDYYGSMEPNPFEMKVEDLSGNDAEWDEWTKRNVTDKTQALMKVWETIQTRMLIFKFDEPKLLLQESINFKEKNQNGSTKYTFMPIASNIGILFFVDATTSGEQNKEENSIFFENDITKIKNETIYKNAELIKQKQKEYIEEKEVPNKEEEEYQKGLFLLFEASNYYSKEDIFVFDVLKENSRIADVWNAKALIESNSKVLIYQDEKHIKEAEKQVSKISK
ncbi:hypothetical protein [Mycoplasma todarodis]|uniref:Uncharacterized protein n=1 Tax=Mycoplasma todarodis TaxID=1937191 RepID=A0A4V2NID3_9MOLU|nr:hypothetical protein [Mycoplasma todarodis]TCG12076.1 hypothetical protein C4B25_00075 [Mycoplasma todarodis]